MTSGMKVVAWVRVALVETIIREVTYLLKCSATQEHEDDIPLVTLADAEAFVRDAMRYQFLRDNPRCSMQLSHNDHHNMYMSVSDTLDDSQGYYREVGETERLAMIESDSIWTFHEYPNTPVGFNVWHGATLDAAIDAAMQDAALSNLGEKGNG